MRNALTPSGLLLDLSKTEQVTLWSLCMSHKRAEIYTGQGDEHTICGKHLHTKIRAIIAVSSYSFNNILYKFYKPE